MSWLSDKNVLEAFFDLTSSVKDEKERSSVDEERFETAEKDSELLSAILRARSLWK